MIVPSPAPGLDALASVPLEHHRVPQPWGDQHVVTAGPAGAPPVLLVHGWPQHWLAWRHVIAALAADARVIAVDQRWFGWSTSDGVPRVPVIEGLAADLQPVLDHFELDRVALAGHDWGGWVGFRAVLDRPERFSAFGAVSIMAPWLRAWSLVRHFGGWSYMLPMAAAGAVAARRPRWVRAMVDHSTTAPIWDRPVEHQVMTSYQERIGQPDAATATTRLYRSFVARDLWRSLGKRPPALTVPTTVIVGDHETITIPGHWQARTYPGEIDLVTVPGARHWLLDEAPDPVVTALRHVVFGRSTSP